MLAYFDVPITWTALLKRTATQTQKHRGLGIAAELAYYFFLALFPALLFGLALVGFFPSAAGLPERIANSLGSVAPPEVTSTIHTALSSLCQSRHGGLLTFGVLAALLSSSSAIVALIDALDRVYDVEDPRPWWRQRVTAILLAAREFRRGSSRGSSASGACLTDRRVVQSNVLAGSIVAALAAARRISRGVAPLKGGE